MFTLLRPELPKASIKPLNLHLAQSPKITTRAVYLKVTGASGFYPLAALSAEPWLARDSLFQGLLETYVHPSGVGPSSTVNHPQPSTKRSPTSVTVPSSMTSFTDNQDPLHPVCLLSLKCSKYIPPIRQLGVYLLSPPLPHSFYLLKAFMTHICLRGTNDA